jgi:hypothetical protein
MSQETKFLGKNDFFNEIYNNFNIVWMSCNMSQETKFLKKNLKISMKFVIIPI